MRVSEQSSRKEFVPRRPFDQIAPPFNGILNRSRVRHSDFTSDKTDVPTSFRED